MLIIGICYGTYSDPFTTSVNATPKEVDYQDADACRKYLCLNKDLEEYLIDEILLVGLDSGDPGEISKDCSVIKHYRDALTYLEPTDKDHSTGYLIDFSNYDPND